MSSRVPRRFLVVIAHPVKASFIAALAQTVTTELKASGHDIRIIDLYGEDFDARLTKDEWRSRADAASWPQIASHVALLRWADGLIVVYPTWFGAQPAILKGWFDRVWGEGIAYGVPVDGGRVRGLLGNIRSIDAVTTHGSGKIMNSLQGEPGKRVLLRGMRSMCGLRCRGRWHAFYGNDTATPSARTAFIEKIRVTMSKK